MSDTVRWCFTHKLQVSTHKLQVSGNRQWCINGGHQEVSKCDVGGMVPVRAGTELFQRPPQGDCTICGERNLTNNCFESLDGDAWCYKEGRVGEGTE